MPYIGFSNVSQQQYQVFENPDINGTKLKLDADGDTSITSDTDDQIDIEISGADDFQFTANTFTAQSGSTIAAQALTATTGVFSSTVSSNGFNPDAADGAALGSASLEFSDLYLADGSVIYLGNDQDVTLTHVADTGILLNGTMQLQFNDSSQYINAPSNAILDINATDEIELNATAVDLNGTLDVSGATTAAAITASGIIKTDDTTAATSTTDGSLQTDGGLSVAADAVIGDDLKLLSDAAVLSFGADSDVTVTHVADTGLTIKNAHTSGNSGIGAVLTLQTGDTDMADGNVLGHIKFQAPDEGAGTDAILVAAGILAEAEGDFSSSSNATAMVFQTGSSEAAAEKMRLDSNGDLGIGVANPTRQLHIAKSAAADVTALSDGATITPDFAAAQNFSVTLAGNRTLANPTNIVAGQCGSVVITQDGTGSRTLAYGGYWDFAGGTAPTLTTSANAIDRIDYYVASGTDIHAVATLALS